jgi:CRP/FNR family cyclic AMP-dependent transcriptional regulator
MSESSRTLRERARRPTEEEFAGIPWLALLEPADQAMARQATMIAMADAGDLICRIGRPATYWFGVVSGLLKMSNDGSQGPVVTFTGVPPGAWFGEGTLLKRESFRYNIEALRPSAVAGLPVDAFHDLLNRSIPFNRFVLNQLNERLGQFIMARETDRPGYPRGPQPGGIVSPGAVSGCGRVAADHPAGVGLPGRAVTPAGERGTQGLAGP